MPGENEHRVERYDEGHGHGFDNMVTTALVVRHCTCDRPLAEIRTWYRTHLEPLGWTSDDGGRTLVRNESECFTIHSVEEAIESLRAGALESLIAGAFGRFARPRRSRDVTASGASYSVLYEVGRSDGVSAP